MADHKHEENCGCGSDCDCVSENTCGCGCGEHDTEEALTVTLTLEDDEEVTCNVLCIYSVGEQEYVALLPLDESGDENEEGHVFIYRYAEEDNQPVIENIETDEEYEAAAEAFDEWLDEQEFDEIQHQLDQE